MMKYYHQGLILISFLFLGFKAEENGNEKINKYNSISFNENKSKRNIQNIEKNEVRSENKKRLLENWQPIEIYVDLKSIEAGIKTAKNNYSYLNITHISSAIDKVKETLKNLISVDVSSSSGQRDSLTISSDSVNVLQTKGFESGTDYNSELTSIGEKADLIILIRYSTDSDNMGESYAKPEIIQRRTSDNRPEVGIIILHTTFG